VEGDLVGLVDHFYHNPSQRGSGSMRHDLCIPFCGDYPPDVQYDEVTATERINYRRSIRKTQVPKLNL
jgi:hypothetical protein